eukprot:INCI5615.1.p1 GENE.INCI5615.1~~INCI5615.1.p1  ORF type:complete len:684 (-),score=109.88 INCI5615.1:242-2203(-)
MARAFGIFSAALLLAAVWAAAAPPFATALSPSAIVELIQPTSSATVSTGALPTTTYSLYAYYQQLSEVAKAARAGALLHKVANRSSNPGTAFFDVVKQLGKKHGRQARSFFQHFATSIAGETDSAVLADAAAEMEKRIVEDPAEPHWHIARAIHRTLACARSPNDFSCLNMLKEVPRELSVAMELVFYRNRTLSRRGSGQQVDAGREEAFYASADAWAPHLDDFVATTVAIGQDLLDGLRRLRGYIWQRSVGYHGMVMSAWQSAIDFPTSVPSRSTCCSAEEDDAHLAKRLDASVVTAALKLAEHYSTTANTPGKQAVAQRLLGELITLLERVVSGTAAETQDLTKIKDALSMGYLNRGNIAGSFAGAFDAYGRCIRYALEAGRYSYHRAELALSNLRHKGNQFNVPPHEIDIAQNDLRAEFQHQSSSSDELDITDNIDTAEGEPALDSACEAGPVTTVSERHALQGKTKTDLRRDYANVPCLVSYPRSGNHYLRFITEFITGRPTAGCASGQNYQPALGQDQTLDWPIATVDFRQEEDVFAHVDMTQSYVLAKYHASSRLWTTSFRPECPLPATATGKSPCPKLLFLVRDFRECVPRHMPQLETMELTKLHTDWWFSLIDDYIQFEGPKLLVRCEFFFQGGTICALSSSNLM